MNAPSPVLAAEAPYPSKRRSLVDGSVLATVVLAFGCVAIAVPTMVYVARESWSTEQGAHGPLVLATGTWLLWRLWPSARAHFRQPPLWRVALMLTALLPLYFVARISGIIELEGFAMYALLLTVLYSAIGGQAMRKLWFPLLYLAFIFPPPEQVTAALTLPLKIFVSKAAISLLSLLGYPIGGSGVMIVVGQYELLVAAACSGLNSLISLTALSLFYVYIRHQAHPAYALLLALAVFPIAIFANLIRVLLLILLTYHLGDSAAQGFLHDFAGLLMFSVALATIFALDEIVTRWWRPRWIAASDVAVGDGPG